MDDSGARARVSFITLEANERRCRPLALHKRYAGVFETPRA